MKRMGILIGLVLLLVACGDRGPEEEVSKLDEIINEFSEIADEHDEKEIDVYEQADAIKEEIGMEVKNNHEVDKELYITMLNMLLNEYDENHIEFDTEAGTSLYKLIVNLNSEGMAEAMKESIIDNIDTEKEQQVYSDFYDDVINLEETFSYIDWSD